ncbi:ABC transporter substrate-binding protein [Rhizobium leguminosarum]|uniref:ABC transporter substrate-binding protein n=1 Tax=Rhizobium leguminosarum TaxID=384 RepID=UPI0024A9030B|nr:ABC transporter substrate-binding protein [Rhizobium leguminosarum]MDI5929580.1 ABC transporter substrate-binding protein [Rhizobium leguminosarum]
MNTGKKLLSAAVVIALAGATKIAHAEDSFVYSAFGGFDVYQKAWTEPYTKKTGVKITVDQPIDFAKIKAQVESGNVYWDVAHLDGYFAAAECGKLFAPLSSIVDKSKIDKNFDSNACSVPIAVNAAVLVYDKNEYKEDKPQGWADFFDTKKFPGKRALLNFPINGVLEAALLADGVPADKLYPMDLDRAFKKLDTIKKDLVFTQSSTQLVELLVSESAPMAITFNGRAYVAVKEGAPYETVWNQPIFQTDGLVILKGSKKQTIAEQFLNYIAQPEQQVRLAQIVPYAPATKDTKVDVDPLMASFLPTNPANSATAVTLDVKWVGDNFDEINRRWTEWTSN